MFIDFLNYLPYVAATSSFTGAIVAIITAYYKIKHKNEEITLKLENIDIRLNGRLAKLIEAIEAKSRSDVALARLESFTAGAESERSSGGFKLTSAEAAILQEKRDQLRDKR